MKLVNGFSLIEYAMKKRNVLPAFNTTNLEMTIAIARGLDRANLPGYIQVSSSNLKLSGPEVMVKIAEFATKGVDVPIAMHLDHGKSFDDVKTCLDAGFTSIMIDASGLPFEENVREVKRVVEYCHFYDVPVEAEIGALRGKEDTIENIIDEKTDPNVVRDFAELTGCDLLAVSVGNVHGLCIQPEIDLKLLEKIHKLSPVPLVLHGGSGIPADVIWAAKSFGLLKINYGADIRKAFIEQFGKAYELDHNAHNVFSLSFKAVESVSAKVCELAQMINRCTAEEF